jgi:hypothetical protein
MLSKVTQLRNNETSVNLKISRFHDDQESACYSFTASHADRFVWPPATEIPGEWSRSVVCWIFSSWANQVPTMKRRANIIIFTVHARTERRESVVAIDINVRQGGIQQRKCELIWRGGHGYVHSCSGANASCGNLSVYFHCVISQEIKICNTQSQWLVSKKIDNVHDKRISVPCRGKSPHYRVQIDLVRFLFSSLAIGRQRIGSSETSENIKLHGVTSQNPLARNINRCENLRSDL